ncbi:MAG: acetyltransferase [Acidimicrobiia bacterium]|nr:acetyltransferase [Acidimicrobiia bacterium]
MTVFVALVLFANETARLLYPLGFLLTQAATATMIVVALRPGWLTSTLSHRLPRWLGRRSYGIYLWHWPLVVLTRGWSSRLLAGMFTIPTAIILGALSYGLVEKRFMHRSKHPVRMPLRARRIRAVAILCAVGAAVVLLARLPATDPITHSLQVGQRVLASQASPAAANTLPVTTVTPTLPTGLNTPSTTAVAAPAPPAPPPIQLLAIGDSVMVGAAPALQARLGSSAYIDAHIGRQFSDGVALVKSYKDRGRLGQTVVVHLGDNGPVHPSDLEALIDELAGVPNVLLMNVRVPREWEAEVNSEINAAIARHPNVKLVDWFAVSGPHPEWFESDHTHLKEAGMAAFADLIVRDIPPPPAPPPTTTTMPLPPITTVSGPTLAR